MFKRLWVVAMLVHEIFKSCQGEGPGARLPVVFVRMSGCNLAISGKTCSWCDTKYAQVASAHFDWPTDRVVEVVNGQAEGCSRVCVTGGEPLNQVKELTSLVKALQGYFVEVFTNGTLFPPMALFQDVDSWVVDIKTPSSGVSDKCKTSHWLGAARPQDAIKFVVGVEQDLAFVVETLRARSTRAPVFISPCITDDVLREGFRTWLQRVWTFCYRHNYCFGLQLHKVAFGNAPGV